MVEAIDTATLGGIRISRMGLEAGLHACRERIAVAQGGYACFVNVHTLTDPTVHAALARATYCFADGVPLLWLARAAHAPIAGRVAGPDFMAAMLEYERDRVHGLIGGAPGVGEAIAARFEVRAMVSCPRVEEFSEHAAVAAWNEFLARCPGGEPPRIVWVGLGAPKQELWLATVSPLAPDVMFFGVGAAFDVLAGTRSRAPRALQRLGLEWTYRLAQEPRRLWKRYLIANTRFAALVVRQLSARPARSRRR